MKIIQPSGWPKPKGYANGMLARGQMLFIAGQVGWNENEEMVSERFHEQVRQVLHNISAILNEAGALPEHLVRMTWFVTHKSEYEASLKDIGKAYREVIGNHYPAMTLVEVKSLLEKGAKVEIEATAVIPDN